MVFVIAWKLARHSAPELIFLENGLVRKLNGLMQICSRKPFIECLREYIWEVR